MQQKPQPTQTTTAKLTQETDDLSSEKSVDYTRLRDLLKAGQWKKADEETLTVMLKASGISEGWLSFESIDNFPCTDLGTIDQLWVKYSNGHFGFSVQKRIWESVGKDYEKFGDRVGWRKGMFFNKEWLSYSDLTFTKDSPQGHLPGLFVKRNQLILYYISPQWRERQMKNHLIKNLFSRVETCKL